MWRRAIDDERKFWDVKDQLEYWCQVLSGRGDALRELKVKGWKTELDCYINFGPIALIELPAKLLKKLASLEISLKLGFYDVTGMSGKDTGEGV